MTVPEVGAVPPARAEDDDEIEPVGRLRGRSPREVAGTAGLVALPGLVCVATGVETWFQGNGIDPFIYVGVVERLHDFLLRWTNLYFPYRFGYVLPEWAAERVLGDRLGYLVLRFALLGLVALTLTGGGRLPRRAAAAGGLVVALSPVVHRALFSTYTESLAFAFLMLGAALLVDVEPAGRRGLLRAACGAVALGLAWNAQFAALTLAAMICAVVLVDSVVETRGRLLGHQLTRAGVILAGVLAVVAGGLLVYGLVFHVWDVYGPTIEMARRPIDPVFIDRHWDFFTWRHYLLVLPLSLAAGGVAWRTTADPGLRRALRRLVVIVALATLFFGYLEWGRDGAILSVYYYSSYPMALAILLLGRSLATALAPGAARPARHVLLGLALVTPFVGYAWLGRIKPPYAVVALVGLVVVAATAALEVRRRSALPFGLLAVVVVSAWATVSSPHDFPGASPTFRLDPRYDATFFRYDERYADLYAVTDDYARALPSLPGTRGEIRVWFDSDPASPTNQVQSALAHLIGALQLGSDPPMPALAEFPRRRLDVDRPRFVVILDTSADDVAAGERALADAGEPYAVVWRKTFAHGDVRVVATLMERSDGQWRDFPCKGPDDIPVVCG